MIPWLMLATAGYLCVTGALGSMVYAKCDREGWPDGFDPNGLPVALLIFGLCLLWLPAFTIIVIWVLVDILRGK